MLGENRPLLCLVTDRRRLGEDGASDDRLMELIAEAVRAGVDLVQIRERDLPGRELERLVTRAVELAHGTACKVIVNDRLDVALTAGAAGVHLRGDSVPASRVRAVAGPHFVIGRSVHSAEEAAQVGRDGGVDYLVLGTMFPTISKAAGHQTRGLDELERAVRLCPLPILAIGGITIESLPAIARTGAAGVAAIGLFVEALRRERSKVAEIIAVARAAFGS